MTASLSSSELSMNESASTTVKLTVPELPFVTPSFSAVKVAFGDGQY